MSPAPSEGPHVFTALRVRPPFKSEIKSESNNSAVQLDENGNVTVSTSSGPRPFGVDAFFASADSSHPNYIDQPGMYDEIGRAIVERALLGRGNSTVLAYGPNSSGKTFTLVGPPSGGSSGPIPTVAAQHASLGLVPRMCYAILQAIDGNANLFLSISMVEVGAERIRDLAPGVSSRSARSIDVRLRQTKQHTFVAENMSKFHIKSVADVRQAIHTGLVRRGSSEKCHIVYRLAICHVERSDGVLERVTSWLTNSSPVAAEKAVINLVDLVSSEKARPGGLDRSLAQQQTSLRYLGSVVAQLNTDASTPRQPVPYRSSKLTSLLTESMAPELGGRTVLIGHASAAAAHADEAVLTLQFISRGRPKLDTIRPGRYGGTVVSGRSTPSVLELPGQRVYSTNSPTAKQEAPSEHSSPSKAGGSPNKAVRALRASNSSPSAEMRHGQDPTKAMASVVDNFYQPKPKPRIAASKSSASVASLKDVEALKAQLIRYYRVVGADEKIANVQTIASRYAAKPKELSEKLYKLYGVELESVTKSPESPQTPLDGEMSDIMYITKRQNHFEPPADSVTVQHAGSFWGSSRGWDDGVDKQRAQDDGTELGTFATCMSDVDFVAIREINGPREPPRPTDVLAHRAAKPTTDTSAAHSIVDRDEPPHVGAEPAAELVVCTVKNDPYTRLAALCGFDEAQTDEEVEWFMDLSGETWSTGGDDEEADDGLFTEEEAETGSHYASSHGGSWGRATGKAMNQTSIHEAIHGFVVTQQLSSAEAELASLEAEHATVHHAAPLEPKGDGSVPNERLEAMRKSVARLSAKAARIEQCDGHTNGAPFWDKSPTELKQILKCALELLASEVDVDALERQLGEPQPQQPTRALQMSVLV